MDREGRFWLGFWSLVFATLIVLSLIGLLGGNNQRNNQVEMAKTKVEMAKIEFASEKFKKGLKYEVK